MGDIACKLRARGLKVRVVKAIVNNLGAVGKRIVGEQEAAKHTRVLLPPEICAFTQALQMTFGAWTQVPCAACAASINISLTVGCG